MNRSISPNSLKEKSQAHTQKVRNEIQILDQEVLTRSPYEGSWSVIQVLQHLNLTLELYLPRVLKVIDSCPELKADKKYKSSMLAGWFSRSQRPKNGKRMLKVKTFKFFVPQTDLVPEAVIGKYLEYHTQLQSLIEKGKTRDISKAKVVSAAGPVIKFRLHEAFDFLLNHEERHFRQIEETIELHKSAMLQNEPSLGAHSSRFSSASS